MVATTKPARPILLGLKTAPATPAGGERQIGGQPVRRFIKQLIYCGQFVKESDGLEFEVTQATLDHWVATCSAFLSAGNKIPIPANHTNDAEANRGWVVEVYKEGDALYAVVDLVGDGIKLAGTCDTSIFCPPDYTDGKGNRYVRPILHVALCTDPVIPGLQGFLPLAASSGPIEVDVFQFSQAGDKTMPMTADPLNPQTSQNPEEQAGGGGAEQKPVQMSPTEAIDQATEQQLMDTFRKCASGELSVQDCLKTIGDMMKKYDKIHKLLEPEEPDETRAAEEGGDVEASQDGEEEEKKEGEGGEPPIAASHGKGRNVDPMVVRFASDKFNMEIDSLVTSGKIPATSAVKLKARYIGEGGKQLALSLSRSGPDGRIELDSVLEVLRENGSAVATGEKSKAQVPANSLVLSNSRIDKPGQQQAETGKAIDQMWSMLPGAPKPPGK